MIIGLYLCIYYIYIYTPNIFQHQIYKRMHDYTSTECFFDAPHVSKFGTAAVTVEDSIRDGPPDSQNWVTVCCGTCNIFIMIQVNPSHSSSLSVYLPMFNVVNPIINNILGKL